MHDVTDQVLSDLSFSIQQLEHALQTSHALINSSKITTQLSISGGGDEAKARWHSPDAAAAWLEEPTVVEDIGNT